MILTQEDVKTYLRLDNFTPEEFVQLEMLVAAAENYLLNATGTQYDNTNQLAKLYCLVLVADWYENREMVGSAGEKVRLTIQSIQTQLKYCCEQPEVVE